MAIYTYNSTLLSAAKHTFPPTTNCILSASGVNMISLTAPHEGISFNSVDTLNNYLSAVRVFGSLYMIDTAYHNVPFSTVNTDNSYTTFIHNSSFSVATLSSAQSLSAVGREISDPEQRRLRYLGYI